MKKLFNRIINNFIENAYFIRKRVLAVVMTAFLVIFSAMNLVKEQDKLRGFVVTAFTNISSGKTDAKTQLAKLDANLVDSLYAKMNFIEYFSYAQKVMDKKEINNFAYIKDETGSLHYASFYKENNEDCFEYALRMKRMQDYVASFGTDVLFVVAPSKYVSDDGRMSIDMPVNDPQLIVDETLFYLNRLGVKTLDLNRYIPNNEVPYEEAFFKTDHHWTIPAAFSATRVLAASMNEMFGYDLDTSYLDDERFKKVIYRQRMLGSMGRATGANYSGMDDMTALYPDYHLDIYRRFLEENNTYTEYTGDVEDTIILNEPLSKHDIYSDSLYSIYLNGLRQYEHIENRSNPEGKKIFMIRDSYFSPVIAFLTPMCSEVDAMWSLENSEELNIEQYIRDNRFDCIIVEMYPYNIGEEAFRFFVE